MCLPSLSGQTVFEKAFGIEPGAFARVALTDAAGCPRPLPDQVLRLRGAVDAVIVRAKELDDEAYAHLYAEVGAACDRAGIACIAHAHHAVISQIGATCVHLPLPELLACGRPCGCTAVGTNVHELDEIPVAVQAGADYVIASPIWDPSCKPGVEGRGAAFLRTAVHASPVAVLALGGVTDARMDEVSAAGARGACRMSDYMRR